MIRSATIAFSLLFALACGTGTEPGGAALSAAAEQPLAAAEKPAESPVEEPQPLKPLSVWAHDARLEASARRAAERIERATGLQVLVNVEGTLDTALPIFFSESGRGSWWGHACVQGEMGSWIAINVDSLDAPDLGAYTHLDTVLLHELLHQFGAGHHDDGMTGLMSAPPTIYDLTGDDLELVCSVAPCTRFLPEVP